jgi:hypothetical protein
MLPITSPAKPWVLSRLNPEGNATKGDNSVDNVEVVDFVPTAAGEEFTVRLNFSSGASGWSPFGENRRYPSEALPLGRFENLPIPLVSTPER